MDIKIFRFMILLLPYLSIYSAYGLTECLALMQNAFNISGKNSDKKDYLFFALFVFLIISSVFTGLFFIRDAKLQKMNDLSTTQQYYFEKWSGL